MTKKEAFRILRITHDIKYTYKNADGSVNFMTIVDTYKAQAEADMRVGSYSITQTEIDDAYNYLQAQYNAKVTGATTTDKSKSKVTPILIATGAILLTGAFVVGGISMLANLSKNNGLPNKPGTVQGQTQNDQDYISFMGYLTD